MGQSIRKFSKRRLGALVMVTLVALSAVLCNPTAILANEIVVKIDGAQVAFEGQEPVIDNGRTLVPVRGVFEALRFNVSWDGGTQTAILARADAVIHITVGSSTFTTNGVSHTLDVPAQIINGRTMIPLRAVLESVGYSLNWNSSTSTISISDRTPEEQVQQSDSRNEGSLVGQWEMNNEATADALMPYMGTGVTRSQLLDEVGKIEATYHFYEDGTGKFISQNFGNGTISWSSDDKQLRMKITSEAGQIVDRVIDYGLSNNSLTFYSDGKVAQVFRRASLTSSSSNTGLKELPNNLKAYDKFPEIVDFGALIPTVNQDAIEKVDEGNAVAYTYYITKNGKELEYLAAYVKIQTDYLGFELVDTVTAVDPETSYGAVRFSLAKGNVGIEVVATDMSTIHMMVVVAMGRV